MPDHRPGDDPPGVCGERAVRAAVATAAAALGFLVVALPASGAPTARPELGGRTFAAGGGPAPCGPSEVTGLLDLGAVGGSNTSPGGAMVFRDVAPTPCTLKGAPAVAAVNAMGAPVPLYEMPVVPRHDRAVVLTPGRSGRTAAASVTWSYWGCPPGSYSLRVRFTGWAKPDELPSSQAAAYSGPPCTNTGQTIYVGAVATRHG
jgi:hypothetical protein